MAAKLYSLNGNSVKGISLTDAQSWIDAGFTDWWLDKATLTPSSAYSMSGWVFRCVNIRANAVAALPWALYRGDTEIADSTGDNRSMINGLDWIDDLPTMLYLAEGAMSILGVAYWYKMRTRGKQINELKWLAPDTMTPRWSRDGLQYFERKIGSDTLHLPTDDVIYFRYPNPLHETEPGVSPVAAALADVGVIVNLTEFAAQFFKRGAIRSTLLTVDGMPPEGEKQRLKSWWQRVIGGIGNAFAAEVVSAAVTPVVIGDGVESLNNESLTAEKRESISTALGVPHSLVMSNAANFATAEADRLNFYDTTVIPVSRIVERVLNKQLFDAMGYRFEFRPEALSIYQENEEQRADAVLKYTSAGLPLSLTFEMLGIQLPAGWEYTDLDKIEEAEPTPDTPEQQAQEPQPADVADAEENAPLPDDRKAAEVDTFKRWLKRNPNRLDRVANFKSDVLTDDDKAAVVAEVKAEAEADTKASRIIPRGAGEPLLPIPSTLNITDDDIEHAIAMWDSAMPDYAGLLEAEVKNSAEEL